MTFFHCIFLWKSFRSLLQRKKILFSAFLPGGRRGMRYRLAEGKGHVGTRHKLTANYADYAKRRSSRCFTALATEWGDGLRRPIGEDRRRTSGLLIRCGSHRHPSSHLISHKNHRHSAESKMSGKILLPLTIFSSC